MQPLISARALEDVLIDSLWTDTELETKDRSTLPVYYGIVNNYSFNPERVEKHQPQILQWLDALPSEFKKSGGGGMSFLNMCVDKNGTQWGQHHNMEMLILLGMAIGKVSYPIPREYWGTLPGSVPYITVDL